jgi:hypothetical protein
MQKLVNFVPLPNIFLTLLHEAKLLAKFFSLEKGSFEGISGHPVHIHVGGTVYKYVILYMRNATRRSGIPGAVLSPGF